MKENLGNMLRGVALKLTSLYARRAETSVELAEVVAGIERRKTELLSSVDWKDFGGNDKIRDVMIPAFLAKDEIYAGGVKARALLERSLEITDAEIKGTEKIYDSYKAALNQFVALLNQRSQRGRPGRRQR